MHLENATPDSAAPAADAEVLAPPVGLGELPPHPATSTPLRSAAAVSSRARGQVGLSVGTPCRIGLLRVSGCAAETRTRLPPV
jgi:hypothetical protein